MRHLFRVAPHNNFGRLVVRDTLLRRTSTLVESCLLLVHAQVAADLVDAHLALVGGLAPPTRLAVRTLEADAYHQIGASYDPGTFPFPVLACPFATQEQSVTV